MKYILYLQIMFACISSFAQELICMSSSYENIEFGRRDTTKENIVIALKFSGDRILGERSNSLDKSMDKINYNIKGKYKDEYVAVEEKTIASLPMISTIAGSISKNTLTYVALGPNGVSVLLLNCVRK